MHLAYNTELDAAYVNGAATTKNGNTFTYNVPADAAIIAKPALTFDCHVHDQMQTIEWLNDGEWVNGKLTARVINYGENSLDSTHYFVVLQRAPQTTFAHKAVFNGTYDKTIKHTTDADSVFITKPYGDKTIPTLTITPNNIHQRFAMLKDGNTITVVVTNELGMDSTTVYVFAEETSNSTALQEFGRKDAGTMEVDGTNYTVVENEMPELEWTKEHVGQTVHTTYTADGATVVITALDGKTTATLNVTRNTPVVYVKATMESFSSNVPAELKDNTEATAPKPAGVVSFTRASAAAAVVFTQTPDSMLWHVTGSANDSTYTLRYPAEASSNANLQAILINGELMDGFYEGTYEYDAPVYADSTAIVEAIGAEPEQTIHLQMNNVEGGIHYDVAVTAADGVASHTYKFDVTKPKSAINTLAAIRCDDKLITGFHPDSLTYEVIVPVAKYKKEQPKMPSITYEAGQKGQKITMAPSLVFGTATTIEVMSETGVSLEYSVTVRAQKSSCVDLSGITVNGALLEDFEPGRRNYSVSLKDTNVVIAYTSEDNFQTYTKDVVCVEQGKKYLYGVTVTAENGLDSARYVIDVYIERMSDDTQLANITLDGQQIIDYERGMNPKQIPFDPGTNRYTINLHPDSTNLPVVRAELATENQIVQITKQSGDTVLLEVSVKDNPTKKNTYSLFFNRPKSTNADLAMIYINGDTLNYLDGEELRPFQPTKYVYTVRLKEGIHELPQVAYDYDRKQSVDTIWDAANDQIQIHVSAEDTSVVNSYLVVFQFTRSAADTLLAIYADGVELPDFSPSKLHYNDTLEVGRKNFPELSWQEKDDYQTIQLDTVSYSADGSQLVRSITVTAENGHSKSYIITYVIRKSGLATLANLLVDSKPLAGFDPNVDNYNYELTAEQATALEGALPSVEVVEGDEWQTVLITQAPDTLNEKTLGQMSIITVTAASGATMRYTIHYPVALSTDAKLNMILLEGKPLSNFDSERYNYRVEIDNTSAVPVVSVIKKEEAQNYEIRVMDDTVRIVVKAESKLDSAAYTLIFERVLSGNTKLNNIILTDQAGAYVTPNQFRFNPAWDSYTIDLNWEPGQVKDSLLPTMEFDLADTLQSVRVEQTELEDGSIQMEIIVTAANKDEGSYFITFRFTKPGDNTLKALFLNGEAIVDFSPMELEYTYEHPYGTEEADYFTPDQLSYILNDSLATAVDSINDNYTLFVTVTAQNGKQRVYAINQVTGEDNNADLAWIAVDGDLIQDFDPSVTFYTYDVYKGAATPSITAEQASPNASAPTVEDISKLGDTCNIRVKAANGDVKVYQVYIRETLDKGIEASANDVLIKRVPGAAQYFVASIRSGVKFALFDLNRQVLLDSQPVPEANLNYADVYKDTQDKDVLADVLNPAEGLIVNVDLGKPYIYVFWYNNKKVKSGIIIAQ